MKVYLALGMIIIGAMSCIAGEDTSHLPNLSKEDVSCFLVDTENAAAGMLHSFIPSNIPQKNPSACNTLILQPRLPFEMGGFLRATLRCEPCVEDIAPATRDVSWGSTPDYATLLLISYISSGIFPEFFAGVGGETFRQIL